MQLSQFEFAFRSIPERQRNLWSESWRGRGAIKHVGWLSSRHRKQPRRKGIISYGSRRPSDRRERWSWVGTWRGNEERGMSKAMERSEDQNKVFVQGMIVNSETVQGWKEQLLHMVWGTKIHDLISKFLSTNKCGDLCVAMEGQKKEGCSNWGRLLKHELGVLPYQAKGEEGSYIKVVKQDDNRLDVGGEGEWGIKGEVEAAGLIERRDVANRYCEHSVNDCMCVKKMHIRIYDLYEHSK